MIAQQLTKNQALAFAEKLYQIEILSKKGRDALKERIEKNELFKIGSIQYFDHMPLESDISISSLLNFCAIAFSNEYIFRTGITEDTKKEILKKMFDGKLLEDSIPEEFEKFYEKYSEEQIEKIILELQDYLNNQEGPRIENAIADEDSLIDSTYSVNYLMFPNNIHGLSPIQVSGPTMFSDGKSDFKLIHHKRSVTGKTRSRTLNDLLKIGLIDSKIYQEVELEINSKRLPWESTVLMYAAERAFYYENYDKNKGKELQYLHQLKQAGVLSDSGYQQIVQAFKPFELKRKFDYLPYCNNAAVFDLTKYTLDPTAYYTQIIQDLIKVIPGFNYDELNVEIIQKPDEYYKSRMNDYVRISIKIDTNQYVYSFHHYAAPSQSLPDVASNFHEIFNKILIDRGSDQRFYYANDAANGNSNNSKFFALILMTKAQYEAWGSRNPFYRQENHDNYFTTKMIQNFIIDCEKIGLFAHLTDNQINTAKQEAIENYIERYYDIISLFPNTSIDISWESDATEHPYQDNVMKFAIKSNGLFTPSNIVDNFYEDKVKEKEKTKFGFQSKGTQYEMEVDNYYDGIDPSFVSLIDKALEEQQVDGRIYGYISDTEWAGFLFLTLSQYSYLKAKHLTLFEE